MRGLADLFERRLYMFLRQKYFFRYFISFTIPIFCLGMLFFYNNITYTNKDSENYNLALIEQFKSDFDSLLLKTQNTALHMSTDQLILSFNNETNISDSTSLSELLKLLKSYENNISDDITMALYPRGSNAIYLKDEIIPYSEFEKSRDYELALSLSGFYGKLNSISSENSLEIRNSFQKDSIYATILMYPIPTISAQPTSTLCFMIKNEEIRNMTSKYFGDTPVNVYAFNSNLQNVYASDSSQISDVMSAIKSNHLGISEYKNGNSRQIMMRTISENTKYQYIISMPKEVFYSSGQNSMNFLLALIALLVIFSTIMAIWLAKNYYNSIANVENKNQEISLELNTQCLIVTELVLKRLLNGSIRNPKKLDYYLNCANIVFDKKYYIVITFLFNNCFVTDDQYEALIFYIKSKNTNNMNFYPVKIHEENQVAVIVNFEDNEESKLAIIEDYYNYVLQANIEHFEIGCGGTYESPINISNSFVESVVAVSERINKQMGNCYIFENAPVTEEGFAYPHIEEAVILQSIKNGNPNTAITSLANIFKNIKYIAVSDLILKCLYYNVVNMIVKIASEVGFPLKLREVSELSGYDSLEMLQQKIEEIIRNLSKNVIEFNEHQANSTKLKVIQYVQKNYTDSELSLDKLASEFNLSYTYASKIFKDETGQNFLPYVTQLRFNFIKKMVIESNTPIKDIIIQAGYLDVANFMRKFKKSEGITLGQYRQNNRKI